MVKLKSEKGGVLVLTLMTTIVLSVLGLAMLPLTVMEYKSSHNFFDYQKAYYIAEAGMEEAIAELNQNWDYSGTLGKNLSDGQYDINIDGTGNSRTIIASGKINNIQRTIEANVERAVTTYDLSEMKDFAIFSQGNLSVEELGNIYGGIVGVHGHLYFESAEEEGVTYLLVEGDVIPDKDEDHNKNKNYPENFPPATDKTLMDLSSLNMDTYIEWLKTNFSEKITEFDNPLLGNQKKKITENDYDNDSDSILIIQKYNEVELENKEIFNGLIIVDKANTLSIGNEAVINGMLIFTGNDLKITTIHITGQSVEVNGGIICTNSTAQKGNWKVEIHHNPEVLSNFDDYLPESFEIPSESDLSINVLNWKEIN